MHMIMEFLKGTLQFLISVWIITLLVKYFLRKTLLGRILSLFCDSIWKTIKVALRHTKRLGRIVYTHIKKYYEYISKHSEKSSPNKQEKKAVNDNIINFKTAKKQHNKKHK